MDDPFCIVVDLENCDDMLHWLLACKITFAIATFAVEDEQKIVLQILFNSLQLAPVDTQCYRMVLLGYPIATG